MKFTTLEQKNQNLFNLLNSSMLGSNIIKRNWNLNKILNVMYVNIN